MTVLVYGALNPDIVHHARRVPRPGEDVRSSRWHITWGGKVANTAMALARWHIDVAVSGVVLGNDALGDALLAALEHPRVDLSSVERRSGLRTGHCVVIVTPDGDRTMLATGYEDAVWSPASRIDWTGVEAVVLDAFGGPAAAAVATEARSREVAVVWPDCRPADLHLADTAVWSAAEHDGEEIAPAISAVPTLIVTHGSEPTVAWCDGSRLEAAPPRVVSTDATGAGDVFVAAIVRGRIAGWALDRCLRWANAAGAALAEAGRSGGLPTIETVDALLGP